MDRGLVQATCEADPVQSAIMSRGDRNEQEVVVEGEEVVELELDLR